MSIFSNEYLIPSLENPLEQSGSDINPLEAMGDIAMSSARLDVARSFRLEIPNSPEAQEHLSNISDIGIAIASMRREVTDSTFFIEDTVV